MSKGEKGSDVKSFLGVGTEFSGMLSFEGSVRLDGHFEGEVHSKDVLVVGEEAHIKADISVGSVVVMGKVLGNIKADEKVEIVKGGEVLGNVKTKALFVELGAIFDGNCEMVQREKKVSVLPPAKEAGNVQDPPVTATAKEV